MANSQRSLRLTLVLAVTAPIAESPVSSSATVESSAPAYHVAGQDSGAADKCPLRAADLDKVTPYRWKLGQYQTERVFVPNGSIRVDMCELIAMDNGRMRTGLMVNIARGAHAEAFAKHWRAACTESLMPEARGKVQPIAGVTGGQQCVTPKGVSSLYWIEGPGQTIQVEMENEDAAVAKNFPQVLAAVK